MTKLEDLTGLPVPLGPGGVANVREIAITPHAGLMVLFPGTLRHRVDPYLGHDMRITVAFNLRHPGFIVPSFATQQYGEVDWMWKNFRGVMIAANHVKNATRRISRIQTILPLRSGWHG